MRPNRADHAMIALVVFATILLAACAHPWNVAHEGLEILADVTVSTDRVVRSQMPDGYDDIDAAVLQQVADDLAAYQACLAGAEGDTSIPACAPPRTVDEYMNDWRERARPWVETFEALEAVRDLLIGAEAILATWRDTGTEPPDWSSICGAIGVLQARLTSAIEHLNELDSVDVTIPRQWNQVRPLLAPVCTWVVDMATPVATGDDQ